MLERTYAAIQKAIDSNSKTVTPEHVLEEEEALLPTQLEHEIMNELSKGRLTPSDLSEQRQILLVYCSDASRDDEEKVGH